MAKRVKKQVIQKPVNPVEKSNAAVFFWLVGVIVAITLLIIFVPILKHNLFEKFSYAGVKWEKVSMGQLEFYNGVFPVIYKGNHTANYNLYLRTDPRQNKIPIETNISLSSIVTISLSNNTQFCKNMMVGQTGLTMFLSAFPFVKNVTSGLASPDTAKLYNASYVTCKDASAGRTVIIVQNSANKSIVAGDKDNCVVFNIGNCEYTPVVERYIIGIIGQINNQTI